MMKGARPVVKRHRPALRAAAYLLTVTRTSPILRSTVTPTS
jgi:hypothetical protein